MLNRAAWSSLALSRVLLERLIMAFAPLGDVVFGLDDTIERRRGDQDQSQRDLSRSCAVEPHSLCKSQWVALIELDDAAAHPLGSPGPGVALFDGAGAVRAKVRPG